MTTTTHRATLATDASRTLRYGWLAAVLAGVIAPTLSVLWFDSSALAHRHGPIVAMGLMGMGMIAAATSTRFWLGVALALLTGVGLIGVAHFRGMVTLPHPASTGAALLIASVSFAARGALFSRAHPHHGWIIAILVVGGEAATLLTATWLPTWLLVLLPAQWASTAIQTSITGSGVSGAASVLLALAGTASTTLLVARLLPRRWPYALMFTVWLALSAVVARYGAA